MQQIAKASQCIKGETKMNDPNGDINKLKIRKVFYEMANKDRFELVEELFHTSARFDFNGRVFIGQRRFSRLLQNYTRKFANRHIEIGILFADTDLVCAHWTMVFRISQNDALALLGGITIFEFRNEKIVQVIQSWNASDVISK